MLFNLTLPWHCLYFFPEPQGQGSFLPIFLETGTSGLLILFSCLFCTLMLFNTNTIIYTVENHLLNGGLGDLISENLGMPVNRIGLKRNFITEYGSYEDLRKIAKIDTKSILQKLKWKTILEI